MFPDKIMIEGSIHHRKEFGSNTPSCFGEKSPFHQQLFLFLQEWHSGADTLRLRTSGSTGNPKEIIVRKQQMWQSARATCRFLNLKPGDKALLCLPLNYIAGKMMVIRALYAGLDLFPVEPTGTPLDRTENAFDFAAMIPLQVINSLQTAVGKKKLAQIKTLIIGGSPLDETLESKLRSFPHSVYSTYGMTETLSHIAMRKVNGSDACDRYAPLPDVSLSLTNDSRLIVQAPGICDTSLETNDIAELYPDGRFRILGRSDNIINSGSIKIQIEAVEKTLRAQLGGNLAITSVPHPKLGEAVALLIEPSIHPDMAEKTIKELLPRYQQPRWIATVENIPQTGNGKTDRAATKQLAKKLNLFPSNVRYIH